MRVDSLYMHFDMCYMRVDACYISFDAFYMRCGSFLACLCAYPFFLFFLQNPSKGHIQIR